MREHTISDWCRIKVCQVYTSIGSIAHETLWIVRQPGDDPTEFNHGDIMDMECSA